MESFARDPASRPGKFKIVTGRDFLEAFSQGLAVLQYEKDQQGNGKFLLGRWDENWMYSF